MANYNTNKKFEKPATVFPELIEHLAKISYHATELGKLANAGAIGAAVGLKKQNMQVHINKVRKQNEK